ncbi:hypothetical protein YTPLAS21_19150 [Candidatus Nitrosocosmicus sp.]|nr:hypothetical protein YTPLAS21_19150 [Candidatus Nitrosocosmicus sp.]
MDENQVGDVQGLNGDVQAQEAEKMLTQSHVNNIVKSKTAEAIARTRQEAEAEFQRRLEEERAKMVSEQSRNNQNVSRETNVDQLYQEVQERFNKDMEKKQLEQEMQQVAQNYLNKMQKGAELYDDFNDITKQFDPGAFPELVYLVSGMDNAADVIYELANNPMKLTALDSLARRAPQLAQREMQKLAASIQSNRQGSQMANQTITQPPLDRLTPSRANKNSDGNSSIQDFRGMDWLRG